MEKLIFSRETSKNMGQLLGQQHKQRFLFYSFINKLALLFGSRRPNDISKAVLGRLFYCLFSATYKHPGQHLNNRVQEKILENRTGFMVDAAMIVPNNLIALPPSMGVAVAYLPYGLLETMHGVIENLPH